MKKIIFALSFFFLSSFSYAELHPRDLDGELSNGHEAVYDDVLDITWLRDANYIVSDQFGVSGLDIYWGYQRGRVGWDGMQQWIAAVNEANHLGFNDWRLPKAAPVSGFSFDLRKRNDGSTDVGYGISSTDGKSSGFAGSELAFHYYNNLGAFPYCSSSNNTRCNRPSETSGVLEGSNRANIALFVNLQEYFNWTETELPDDPSRVFSFSMDYGNQITTTKQNIASMVWLVRDGDVDLTDTDGDGVIDLKENCVDVYNPDQLDNDLDGLGNLCDEFPDSDDHEFARCAADLELSISEIVILEDEVGELNGELVACNTDLSAAVEEGKRKDQQIELLQKDNDNLRSLIDSDADGVPDEIDECSGTPPWKWKVNSNGCHQSQMSGSIKQEHMKYPFISIQ